MLCTYIYTILYVNQISVKLEGKEKETDGIIRPGNTAWAFKKAHSSERVGAKFSLLRSSVKEGRRLPFRNNDLEWAPLQAQTVKNSQ